MIGVRCRIGRNVTIRNSVLMGTDYYQSPADGSGASTRGEPALGIGDNTHIEGAIVDKNCRIGRNVRIANDRQLQESPETPECMICDGIVVVPKDAHARRRLAAAVEEVGWAT